MGQTRRFFTIFPFKVNGRLRSSSGRKSPHLLGGCFQRFGDMTEEAAIHCSSVRAKALPLAQRGLTLSAGWHAQRGCSRVRKNSPHLVTAPYATRL